MHPPTSLSKLEPFFFGPENTKIIWGYMRILHGGRHVVFVLLFNFSGRGYVYPYISYMYIIVYIYILYATIHTLSRCTYNGEIHHDLQLQVLPLQGHWLLFGYAEARFGHGGWSLSSEQWKNPGCLGYIGDSTHYTDPYEKTSIMESKMFFFVAQVGVRVVR